MNKRPHWRHDPYRAGEFFGDVLDAVIKVTKTTPKPEPPKPKPSPNTRQKPP